MSKRIRKNIKDYLTFTQREIRGTIYLIAFVVFLIALNWVLPYFTTKSFNKINDVEMIAADSFIAKNQKSKSEIQKEQDKEETKTEKQFQQTQSEVKTSTVKSLHNFNPNSASYDELIQMGFNSKLAHTFINYRNKAGKFKSADDIKKLYGMKDDFFEQIKPFVLIEIAEDKNLKPSVAPQNPPKQPITVTKELIDINSADSVLLTTAKGIGPFTASRIIKFRKRIGAFVSLDQLKDIYGIRPENLGGIQSQLTVKAGNVKSLNINTCTYDELKTHAFFDYKTAKALINYRDQHSPFKSLDDILNCELITKEFLDKNKPYLTIQ